MINEIIGNLFLLSAGVTLVKYLGDRTMNYYIDKFSLNDEEQVIDKDLKKVIEINSNPVNLLLVENIELDTDLEYRISVYSRYIHNKYVDKNPLLDYQHVSDEFRRKYEIKLSVLRTIYKSTDTFRFQ